MRSNGKTYLGFFIFLLPILLSGCTSLQVGSDVQSGRRALRRGDYKVATVNFQRAAEIDPNHVFRYSLLEQSVWTYLGRAQYGAGNLAEARKALERAPDWDPMAKLYLGLTLARDGGRERGRKEIEAGLRGLHAWLDNLHRYIYEGHMWDPGGVIRSDIARALKAIESREFSWPALISRAEATGRRLEDEIEKVKQDKAKDRLDDDDDDSAGGRS